MSEQHSSDQPSALVRRRQKQIRLVIVFSALIVGGLICVLLGLVLSLEALVVIGLLTFIVGLVVSRRHTGITPTRRP